MRFGGTRSSLPFLSLANLLRAALIVLATLWIYAPALHGVWIWDDLRFIPGNPLMNDPARLWKIWFQPQSFLEYYPVEATIQWAQWILWRDHTLGYHLTNVVLHLLSAFLVWRLLAKLGLHCAWVGALLFAVHPVMVESVAWMVELKNTLSLPPLLLAMCFYLDYDRDRRPQAYALAWIAFLLAMLCKVSVMMFPFVILLYAWWKRRRVDAHDLAAAAGFLVITLLLGGINAWIGHISNGTSAAAVPVSVFHRLGGIGWLALIYLWKAFVPLRLLPIYPPGIIAVPDWLLPLPWLLFGGALVLAWKKRDGWGRHLLLGLGFYFLNLGPVAVFMFSNYPSMIWSMDHMVYLPMIGLFGLAAGALGMLAQVSSLTDRLVVQGMAVVAAILLCLGSRAQANLYADDAKFWNFTLQHYPDCVPALSALSIIALQHGDPVDACQDARRAVELAPQGEAGRMNLANALLKLGRVSEAQEQYAAASKISPADSAAFNGVASCLAREGHFADALRAADQALRVQPDFAGALASRGEIKRSLGDLPGARADLDRAIALDESASAPYLSRGVLRQAQGDLPGALDDLRRFRRLAAADPNADYAALWIWIIERKQGRGAVADHDLTDAMAKGWNAAPGDWVTRHALFLLGATAEADYLAAQPAEPGRQCEARYYAGEKRLLAGDKTASLIDFRASVATGQVDFFEYTLAQGELAALSAQ